MPDFQVVSEFQPTGDQPKAIAQLVDGLRGGERMQTLLGATGTGKTFVMAHVIAQLGLRIDQRRGVDSAHARRLYDTWRRVHISTATSSSTVALT